MDRRSGKAGNRRDRQRKAQRRILQRPAGPAQPIGGVVSEAVEAAAERRAESSPVPAPASSPSGARAGRADPRFLVSGPSRLSERAATEYHYVRSDLRNIAVLVVAMAILLAIAVVAFSVLGIGPN